MEVLWIRTLIVIELEYDAMSMIYRVVNHALDHVKTQEQWTAFQDVHSIWASISISRWTNQASYLHMVAGISTTIIARITI
jgi:hypothetical protein